MREASFLDRIISYSNEALFKREKNRLIVRVLAISTAVIIAFETLLMLLLEIVFVVKPPLDLILDGVILAIFLFPLNYLFIVRPMFREVEKRRRTNQELLQSFEVVDRLFSINEVMIAYLDTNFVFLRVNNAYAKADHHTPDYYPGKNHFDLFPNEENQVIFQKVINTGEPFNIVEKPFEYPNNPERGTSYWDWSLLPIKDLEDRVIAVLMVLTDVTARKLAQLALIESERRFRAVFNQTFQHVGLLDTKGNVLLANQTALDFTGINPEVVLGKPIWDAPVWAAPIANTMPLDKAVQQAAAGSVVRMEHQVRSAAGERAVMDITIKPLLDDQDRPVMLLYEARDITTRIRAEEALIRSEEKAKHLYQAEIRAHHLADTLRSAVVALSGSLDSSTVIETLLDHLYKVVPYSSAHVSLLEDEDHLVVRMARGEEKWSADEHLLGEKFEVSDLPFFEALLRNQEMLTVPDTMLYPVKSFFPIDSFVRSWLAIPLLAGERVIGVCILEHGCPNFFTDDLMQWASALTRQAAVAIQNAWLFEQVRDGHEHLQALSRRLVEVQESERLHIARELHDDAGQAMASLLVGLRLLERDGGDQQAVSARSAELKQIANGVLENLHRLAIDLRPALLDHIGLVAALRQHTEMVSDQHDLPIQFETIGIIGRLPGEVETAIYRIVQEALTNVIRHAHATRVSILIEQRGDRLLVIVEDNGVGFDLTVYHENQLGLVGMRERAIMLGGSINIESTPRQGSTVILEVPCRFEY